MGRTVFRVCLCFIGTALLVAGIYFLWSGLRLRAKCKVAETTQPLSTVVDVGAATAHRASLNQSAAFTCRQTISMTTELRAGENAEDLFRGLEMTVLVTDSEDAEWMRGAFPDPLKPFGKGVEVTLVNDSPIPIGKYSVNIEVIKPAPALAGRPVQITSRYHLCGIEWMGPTIGIGAGAIGLTVGAIIAAALWKTRRRPLTHSAHPTNSAGGPDA